MNPIVKRPYYSTFLSKYASTDTRTAYASDLALFDRSLGGKDPTQANKPDVERFILSMQEKGLADRSIRRRMACLKKFYGWLVRMERMKSNPTVIFDDIKTRSPIRNPKALTKEQREHLIKSLKFGTNHEWQVSLAVMLGLHCGLRLNEIRQLKWADIDFEKAQLTIIGKGDKQASLPLSKALGEMLNHYFETHKALTYIFQHGRVPLSRGVMGSWFGKEVKVWCGWGDDVVYSSHVNRHTFCSWLAEQKTDINILKELARHSNINTTNVYIRLAEGAKEAAYNSVFNA